MIYNLNQLYVIGKVNENILLVVTEKHRYI